MTHFLTAHDVIGFCEAEVGPDLLADFGLLDAAVQRPMQTVGGQDAYPDLFTKAAALFHSLIRNHPFIDGNKRLAFMALYVFLGLNGWELVAGQGQAVDLALDVAEGRLDVVELAARIKELSKDDS